MVNPLSGKIRKGFLANLKPEKFSLFFLYTFHFSPLDKSFSSGTLEKQKFKGNLVWKRKEYSWQEKPLQYNEYLYFYPFVREVLFDKGERDAKSILCYKLKDENKNDKDDPALIYNIIQHNENSLALSLKNIYLHIFFESGVGLLSFHIEDTSGKNLSWYLDFINLGRRLYPPYLKDENKISKDGIMLKIGLIDDSKNKTKNFGGLDCPKKVIIHKKGNATPLFSNNYLELHIDREKNCIKNTIITCLLGASFTHFMDDRMFSLCCYKFKKESKDRHQTRFLNSLKTYFTEKNKNPDKNEDAALELYYQLLFIDTEDPTCPNPTEMRRILDDSLYKNWVPYGSLYGFSRYSCVFLTTADYVYNHFSHMYYQIAVILFFYRGILLRFASKSKEIGQKIRQGKKQRSDSEYEKLKREFINFRNTYWFDEVSHQDQGIDIFNLWKSKMNLGMMFANVKAEIDDLHSYFYYKMEKERNVILFSISLFGIPLTIIIGIWGITGFDITKISDYFSSCYAPGWIFIEWCGVGIFTIVILFFLLKALRNYFPNMINLIKSNFSNNKSKYVFFLGGYDGEMREIKMILKKRKQKFFDNRLTWGAALSHYKKELKKIKENEIPVFIELKPDIPYPEKAIIIDHHTTDDERNSKTSLHQVAELLGTTLSRWQELVAINDYAHTKGLDKYATEEEIKRVQAFDREWQGVTRKDEKLAIEAIKNKKELKNLTIMHSGTHRTSPITDNRSISYTNLLILCPHEVDFFGNGDVIRKLKDKYKDSWCGGDLPATGYWGKKTTSEEEKKAIADEIEKLVILPIF